MKRNRIVVTIMKWVIATTLIAVFLFCFFTSVTCAVSTLFWLAVSAFALLGCLAISVQRKIDEKGTREF